MSVCCLSIYEIYIAHLQGNYFQPRPGQKEKSLGDHRMSQTDHVGESIVQQENYSRWWNQLLRSPVLLRGCESVVSPGLLI